MTSNPAYKYLYNPLEFASQELRSDKEVVLEAVKNCGSALEFASQNLRRDEEIVYSAVKNNGLGVTCRNG